MILSADQNQAEVAFHRWYESGYDARHPFFYLGGCAGTGKSTIARHLAEGVEGRVEFCAYTGKAALRMRQCGCPGARTIHNLMYRPTGGGVPTGQLVALAAQLEAKTAEWRALQPSLKDKSIFERARHPLSEEIREIEKQVAELRGRPDRPSFERNDDSAAQGAALIVVDECSMVDERIGADLVSFCRPILVLGDPAQLPPVMGGGYFTRGEPDFLLTEIHRQARESGIIRVATKIRTGGKVTFEDACRDVTIISGRDRERVQAEALAADQILVGRNKTRRGLNKRVRQLRQMRGQVPVAGDRVVCLRNDHEVGVLNGSLWEVHSCAGEAHDPTLSLVVQSLDEEREPVACEVHTAPFLGEDVNPSARRSAQEFDFGYALTVHKAQGSQWPSVCVVDESAQFPEGWRHLYTACTRAAEKLVVVL